MGGSERSEQPGQLRVEEVREFLEERQVSLGNEGRAILGDEAEIELKRIERRLALGGKAEVRALQEWEDWLSARQARKQRKEFASKTFGLLCFWALYSGAVVLLQGFGPRFGFFLSDEVVLAVIGSTAFPTLFSIVLRHIFPAEGFKKSVKGPGRLDEELGRRSSLDVEL